MSIGRHLIFLIVCVLPFAGLGCMTAKGGSVDEKRSYVRKMRTDMLTEIHKRNPKLEEEMRSAAGYAVFSNLSVKIFLLGPGHGYGMLVNNATSKETFMRMAQIGAGVGLGAKTYRVLFVFRDPKTMASFRDSGWQFGGDAEAAVQAGNVGGSTGAQGRVGGSGAAVGTSGTVAGAGADVGMGAGMSVYQLTGSGLALTAGVSGT
ncbi:MAG: hypothetical protein JRH01_15005, partial [Deltaproteobacteria bacterium]|nr:hypothetical protein [Deltaproteobacteria bacterium]